jgi:hypothetical protein
LTLSKAIFIAALGKFWFSFYANKLKIMAQLILTSLSAYILGGKIFAIAIQAFSVNISFCKAAL